MSYRDNFPFLLLSLAGLNSKIRIIIFDLGITKI